ncbi:Transposase [Bacillus thuringiensis serovar monterrey BGSC 4AJ1]|nr:Transposase [Bacillus thuringiensis serovar monterrey BGSC 4AJ1]
MYLYRAVDTEGNTIDFYLSKSRDEQATKRFFKKGLFFIHLTVNKSPAYPVAISRVERKNRYPEDIQLR